METIEACVWGGGMEWKRAAGNAEDGGIFELAKRTTGRRMVVPTKRSTMPLAPFTRPLDAPGGGGTVLY